MPTDILKLIKPIVDAAASKHYIGDGVYASYDGYQIKLETDRIDHVAEIYLEPQVWFNLEAYVKKIRET